MPSFNSIGSGVSEPQVAENRYLPLTGGIALTTVSAYYTVTSRVLRSDGADKHFSIAHERKHRRRLTGKREPKLEELMGQLIESSSENDDDLLDNDVFLDVQPVVQDVRELTHVAAAEQRPTEPAQSLLELRRLRRPSPVDSSNSSSGPGNSINRTRYNRTRSNERRRECAGRVNVGTAAALTATARGASG